MTTPKTTGKTSTRHHVVDARFAALLSEDFGIPTATVLDALEGEPKKAAIAMCGWARKYHKGRCRRAARTTTERPARHHGSPGDDRAGDGRGSGPARPGGINPAFIRANVARMGG